MTGLILTEEGFVDGYAGFEGGLVHEVGRGTAPSAVARGIVLPTLINSHTHLADYRVPLDLSLPLEKIVAPPDGMKHRILEKTPPSVIIEGMAKLSEMMIRRGTSRFIDFREGGPEGSILLRSIGGARAVPTIMGRPQGLRFDRDEVEQVLRHAHGIGVSSISDWDYEELRALSEFVRSKGCQFALHASERVREDIDRVLDLKPSYLVHMCEATESDLEICADAGVPVVICPRSNLFFGKMPPIADMIGKGVIIALGTDNAMVTPPDMLTEMEVTGRLMRYQGMTAIDDVLGMAILGGRKILNENTTIGIQPGSPCDFMVIGHKKGDAMTDVVLRSTVEDPIMTCVGERIWRGHR